jgi:hypothetical protein
VNMASRKVQLHLNIDERQMDKIEELIDSGRFNSKTHVVDYCIRIATNIDKLMVKCKDPEFVKEVEKEWGIEETLDWLDKLSTSQIEIIGKAAEIARRKRDREINEQINY